MVLQCTLIIYCNMEFCPWQIWWCFLHYFLSSPLLRWISCARWSDWTPRIQSTILVLGFLFRWFQYLRENKEVPLSQQQLRTFQISLIPDETLLSRNKRDEDGGGGWKSHHNPINFLVLRATIIVTINPSSSTHHHVRWEGERKGAENTSRKE